jgi:hypothetical protein
MTESIERQSATIYTFPPRGRFAVAGEQTVMPSRLARVGSGDAWYHDQAIEETKRPRKI